MLHNPRKDYFLCKNLLKLLRIYVTLERNLKLSILSLVNCAVYRECLTALDVTLCSVEVRVARHDIALFVEPGEVVVSTPSATQSAASTVSGTPTNDTYAAYKAIAADAQSEADRQVAHLASLHGSEWLASDAGKREVKRIMAQQSIKREAESLRFLIDHNASPMTPMVIEQSQFPKLSAAYGEQIGVSEATIKRRLGELKKSGLIVRVGANKNGHWEVLTRKTSIS